MITLANAQAVVKASTTQKLDVPSETIVNNKCLPTNKFVSYSAYMSNYMTKSANDAVGY